jgi:CheY-like chemotaxis protein
MVTHHSILLIDDSPGECELFRLALIQTGLTVTLFTEQNADAAFHFLNNHSSDLPTLIRLAAIPVVVFTTSDDASDLALAYASGANGYVVKPGTFAELIQCAGDLCRYWLERNRVPLTIGTPC